MDEYLRFVSEQEPLTELFTNKVQILKFANCSEEVQTGFKDMYCFGFNYQVG